MLVQNSSVVDGEQQRKGQNEKQKASRKVSRDLQSTAMHYNSSFHLPQHVVFYLRSSIFTRAPY